MTNNENEYSPELERIAMDALTKAKAEWDDGFPAFSIGEALKNHPDAITPELFHEIANDEMRKVYDRELTLGEDLKIPFDNTADEDYSLYEDVMWITQRNLLLMEKYLREQIAEEADPERIRADLITLDRYLNDWLRAECLNPEDAREELADYFTDYLLKMDPLPPFTPQLGTLGRFYSWMMHEPAVQANTNYEGISTPCMCEILLVSLRRDIPFLTRMEAIASDSANDRPESRSAKGILKRSGRVSGKPKLDRTLKQSTAEKRVENWRVEQIMKNRPILSQIRRILSDQFDMMLDEIEYTLQIAETFLIQMMPMILLTAEESSYYLEEFLRDTFQAMKETEDSEELASFSASFVALMIALADLGLIRPETKLHCLDPYYPDVPAPEDLKEGYFWEAEDISWALDQEPDVYEDHLNWLKWNIDRNGYFLIVFQNELIASGMDLPRIEEHVQRLRTFMAELLRYVGSPMEALPEGLNEMLFEGLGVADFLSDPKVLRRTVGSLRRFYRIMIQQGYLAEETGEALLAYLKRQTRIWMEKMNKANEGTLSSDAMDSIWNLM